MWLSSSHGKRSIPSGQYFYDNTIGITCICFEILIIFLYDEFLIGLELSKTTENYKLQIDRRSLNASNIVNLESDLQVGCLDCIRTFP